MKQLLPTAALLSAALLPGRATAQPPSAPPSVSVSYGDLDLGTAAGQATLQGRLNAAVRNVCRRASTGGTLERRRCVRDTITNARGRANVAIARADRDRLLDGTLASR